jgi:proline iminopeptidase
VKKKVIFIALGAVLLVVVAVGGFMWYSMGQPLYKPGMVRADKNLSAPLASPPQPSGSFWQVEKGIRLYHFSAGQGDSVLVVHGGPGLPSLEPWPGLAPLETRYRFRYYDQRGCGKSTRPFDRFASNNFYRNMVTLERTLGMGAQVADIERIRRILGEERIVLIGHSYGGFIASMYAAEFPERVKALILVAPADMLVMDSSKGGKLLDDIRRRLPAEQQKEYDTYLREYLDFRNLFSRSETELKVLNGRLGDYYREAVKTELPQQGEIGGWMVQALYLSLGMRHDYRSALRGAGAPVLILHGADDLQSVDVAEGYRKAFPRSEIQTIPGAGHFIFSDQPGAFAKAVGEFLDKNQ